MQISPKSWPAIAALMFVLPPARACDLPTTLTHTVTGIVDGRTLQLDDGTELRLASLLAPTAYDSPAAPSPWPAEIAAIEALSRLTLNRNLAISLERQERDRYGRRTGHALLVDPKAKPALNQWLQAGLVSAGHARVALTPGTDATCARELLNLEAAAQSRGLGLWTSALYKTKRAEDLGELVRFRSTYQIIEGVIARVAIRKSVVYLNFDTNWKEGFAAKLSRSLLKRSRINADGMYRLTKRPVRIRGWIENRAGPLITIRRLEQIELLTLSATGESQRDNPIRLLSDISVSGQTGH